MIDKRIFYCWFGKGKKSELNERCIASWHACCPGYEIIEINESNFDYNAFEYSRIAYKHKNWAYVSDIARLDALKKYGGFYLDTDVELFKSLDSIRDNNAIIHETGYGFCGCGVLGCEKYPQIYEEAFKNLSFDTALYVELNTYAYKHYNLLGDSCHKEDDVTFLGIEYFGNPSSPITEKTIGVHWDENSWFGFWKGNFEPLNDFVPFAIHNPNYNEKLTKQWFGDSATDNRALYLDVEPSIGVMELGNYFMNPRVVEVKRDGFRFIRKGVEGEKREKILENGCRLTYLTDKSLENIK